MSPTLVVELALSPPRWSPPIPCSPAELAVLKRCRRTRRLFVFLREHRHELFDDAFQEELASMYRSSGAGKPPLRPALMAMACLLQGYLGVSDAEAVELTVVDLRWQVVLDCLGHTEPAFSQGAFAAFRRRFIAHEMDLRLLERTAELARRQGGFDARKLPSDLRLAVDSAPLLGAGRVEDTINLLAHAARKLVECAATLLGRDVESVVAEAGIPVLSASSVKRGLDRTWSEAGATEAAVQELSSQLESLLAWLQRALPGQSAAPPLDEHLSTLLRLMRQDLEPDPEGGKRIRRGVASDRQVSVEDPAMRHGRKSKSKRFDGYKRHIAADIDLRVIEACAITPANRPEAEAFEPLQGELSVRGISIAELYIDRGYISSPTVQGLALRGLPVVCRPWQAANRGLYSKADFEVDLETGTVRCPAGQVRPARPGQTVRFAPKQCSVCDERTRCTQASPGRGRNLRIAEDEALQQTLRAATGTPEGRQRLRRRVTVEHLLSHVVAKQGKRARYRGVRNNLFDLRRAASVVNLETASRLDRRAA